jgi:hypothetical protein
MRGYVFYHPMSDPHKLQIYKEHAGQGITFPQLGHACVEFGPELMV